VAARGAQAELVMRQRRPQTKRHPPASPPLPLPAATPDWRIDEETREVGRRGISATRAALARAARRS